MEDMAVFPLFCGPGNLWVASAYAAESSGGGVCWHWFAGCSIGEFFAALPRRMSRIETKTPPMSCPLTESQTRRWQLPEASVRAEYSIRRSLSTALMRLTRILLPAALPLSLLLHVLAGWGL